LASFARELAWSASNRLRFLVIDDHAHMRRILHTLLKTLPANRSAQR
jgi:hypothetical protein